MPSRSNAIKRPVAHEGAKVISIVAVVLIYTLMAQCCATTTTLQCHGGNRSYSNPAEVSLRSRDM